MSLGQIALAAECVTLARVDFAQKVYIEPLLGLVQAVVKSPPQTAAEKRRRRKGSAPASAAERDARISAAAANLGIEIEG
jgi:hypothetical protein